MRRDEVITTLRAVADALESTHNQDDLDAIARLEQRVSQLEDELLDARSGDEVVELIADMRRGIIDVGELYDRTLELGPC